MPMKSESREEAAARMKALTEAERNGMAEVQEGQLVAFPRTEEIVAREEAVNDYGEALIAAQDALDDNPLAYAEEEPIDASGNRPARRSGTKRRGNGRRGSRKARASGEASQPEA